MSDELWAAYDHYRLYRTATGATQALVRKNLVKAYDALYEASLRNAGVPIAFQANETDSLTDFRNSLAKLYDEAEYQKLENAETAVTTTIPPFPTPDNSVAAAYDKLLDYTMQPSPLFDSELKPRYFPDPKKATRRILALRNLDQPTYARLLAGWQNLDCDGCKPLDPAKNLRKYDSRLANLKASIEAIDELYLVAQGLSGRDARLKPAAYQLRDYKKALQAAVTQLTAAAELRKSMGNRLAATRFDNYQGVNGSTAVLSFEPRTKLSIGPDFGVVTTRLFSGKDNPYSFVPYLGFHINFRPFNRDIPYKLYPHNPLHRLSGVIGWSLVDITNGSITSARPGQDSISSFFKSKGTLLTGVGIRVSSTIQFTLGSMWYFRYARATTTPPAAPRYDSRQLQAWPYVGVVVDISLKDLFNGITDIFTAAPRAFTPAPVSAPVPVAQ